MVSWVGVRQSVLAAVFMANLMNFTLQWIARKSKDEQITNRMRENHSSVFLFSLVGLLSCNLLQGGVFEAFSAWVVFFSLAIVHILHFKSIDTRIRCISRLAFSVLLFVQCLGSVIHYAA